jgi:hypothetical protein
MNIFGTLSISKAILLTTLFALALVTVGIGHLVYAKKIARYYRSLYPDDGSLKLFFPFRFWMKSPYYEVSMQIFGGLSVAAGILLMLVMIRGLLGD